MLLRFASDHLRIQNWVSLATNRGYLDGEEAIPSKKAVPSTSVGSVATAKRPMSRKPFTAMPSFDVDPKTSTASPEATNADRV